MELPLHILAPISFHLLQEETGVMFRTLKITLAKMYFKDSKLEAVSGFWVSTTKTISRITQLILIKLQET